MYEWRKGDVLALFTPNSIDTPILMWGTLWTGGIVSPANPAYTADEFAFQLKETKAKLIATTLDLAPVAREAAKQAGMAEDQIILLGDKKDPDHKLKHFTSVRNTSGATRYRKQKIDPQNDIAFLCFSSGTSGKPKGVKLSHTNVVANTLQNNSFEGRYLTHEDKIMAFLPFYHIYGLTCIIHQSFFKGFLVSVMPRFDLEDFCKFTQRDKMTFVLVAPPVVLALAKHPIVEKYDLSSIRMMNSGAAPLSKELVDLVWNRKKLKVKQG